MDSRRISILLQPFVRAPLSEEQLAAFAAYLDLLMRWNQRINLTAVRSPEEIVTRHFGESAFAAERLLPSDEPRDVCDVGSGAGFPGLPLKIVRPQARVMLVESHGKKATFLREVIRAMGLAGIEVATVRAETLECQFDLVTLRAVERFADVLPVAAKLVRTAGRIGLLAGAAQISQAKHLLPNFSWREAVLIPQSDARVLLCGAKPPC